ncbi:MAG: hypothetical protein ACK4NA_05895 [Alphaproteobacteria bacterium]
MSIADGETRLAGTGVWSRLYAVLFLSLAAALFALAAPRMIAAILLVPGNNAARVMNAGLEKLTVGQLDSIIDSRQAAGEWIESGRNSNAVGLAAARLLYQMESLAVRQPEQEAAYLDLVIRSLREGLALQPAEPYAWSHLSLALLRRGAPGDLAAAERAWRMSVITAPNEHQMLIQRLTTGLFLWSVATPRTRAMIEAEVLRTARIQPRGMARMARMIGAEGFIREVLAKHPDLLAMFDEMMPSPEAGSPLFP